MRNWIVRPLRERALAGAIAVPGDKSISHRALMLLTLAGGTRDLVTGILEGEDVRATQGVLEKTILSPGNNSPLCDCGNSGTTMRLMMGLLAGRGRGAVLDGDDSLRRRPMERVAGPLRAMSAEIETTGGKPPVTLRGRSLVGCHHIVNVASAQVKSALLLAGMSASGETSVEMPEGSRDHTERMLAHLGCEVESRNGGRWVGISGGATLTPRPIDVPGDISSAAFFIVAGLLVPGSSITLTNVGVNPTRTGILDVIARAGVPINLANERTVSNEPRADLVVAASTPAALTIESPDVPRLIDEIPILALLAAHADADRSVVSGAGELRVKESDRIEAIRSEFAAIGLAVEATADGLVIPGRQRVKGGAVDSRGDHRIAMTAAIAGLVASDRVTVRNVDCVATSFPGFEACVHALGGEIDEQ